jgi:CheY-like chemotaxis protein
MRNGTEYGMPPPPPVDGGRAARALEFSDEVGVGGLKGVRILLVEDDGVSREALELIFTYYGACVNSTDSVDAALERFDREAPSVLVSDIGLPIGDGCMLLHAIRARERRQGFRTPAIAISGYPSPEASQRARQAGFDAFMRKPVEIRTLLKLVAGLAVARAA